MNEYSIVVIGATGNVGSRMISVLEERNFPVKNIYAIASQKSVGKIITFTKDKNLKTEKKLDIIVEDINEFDFSKVQIALVSVDYKVIKKFYKKIVSKNCIIVDNSSAFRKDKKIPLIIPEVNIKDLHLYKNKLIISNPNCSTSQVVLPLKVIDDLFKIKRIIYSTYQSTSGAGINTMKQNFYQSKEVIEEIDKTIKKNDNENELNFDFLKNFSNEELKQRFSFNVIPKIGDFLENGETSEEEKMVLETSKILGRKIKVHANCCRVPVFIGHSVFVNVEVKEKIDLELLEEKLSNFKGMKYLKNTKNNNSIDYSTPIQCDQTDDVFVSRLRIDKSVKNGLSFWCVADNLRKGAALNSVQIAEELIKLL